MPAELGTPPYWLVASYSAFVNASCKLFYHVVPAELATPPYLLVASNSAFVNASCKLFCHVVPAELGFQLNEIQQPSNFEKTSRHMANTRPTIAVAARSGSTIPSYRQNFTNTKPRSTIAVAGRFKEVALQRILPPPIGFEVLVQAGLAAKVGQNP